MEKPKPIPLAMILCDTLIEDRLTGKKSLIGIFNNIASREIPCRHSTLNVFCILTEGIGTYPCCLRCTNLADGATILNLTGPITFPDRLVTIEFNFELKNVVFPTPGQYVFELLCDNQPLISRKFNIVKLEPQSK